MNDAFSRDLIVALWRFNQEELAALLARPEPADPFAIDAATGLSAFWVAGHLAANCANALAILSSRAANSFGEALGFIRGSDPAAITSGDWPTLIAGLEQAHRDVVAAIAWLGPSRLGDPVANETHPLGHMLQVYGQHEAIHIGNLQALIR